MPWIDPKEKGQSHRSISLS